MKQLRHCPYIAATRSIHSSCNNSSSLLSSMVNPLVSRLNSSFRISNSNCVSPISNPPTLPKNQDGDEIELVRIHQHQIRVICSGKSILRFTTHRPVSPSRSITSPSSLRKVTLKSYPRMLFAVLAMIRFPW